MSQLEQKVLSSLKNRQYSEEIYADLSSDFPTIETRNKAILETLLGETDFIALLARYTDASKLYAWGKKDGSDPFVQNITTLIHLLSLSFNFAIPPEDWPQGAEKIKHLISRFVISSEELLKQMPEYKETDQVISDDTERLREDPRYWKKMQDFAFDWS